MKRHKKFIIISIILLIIIFVFAFIKVFSLSRKTTEKLINLNIEQAQDILNNFEANHPAVFHVFDSVRGKETEFKTEINFMLSALRGKNITRFRLINRSNKFIWDNLNENIKDEEIAGNSDSQKALNGAAAYKLEKSQPVEKGQRNHIAQILKIYIPVIQSGQISGAAELHKEMSSVELDIYNNSFCLLTLVMVFALFALLFFILLKSVRNQSAMLKRLEETQDVTIFALAYLAEIRDSETGNHLNRTVFYVHLIAEELRKSNKYRDYITERVYC